MTDTKTIDIDLPMSAHERNILEGAAQLFWLGDIDKKTLSAMLALIGLTVCRANRFTSGGYADGPRANITLQNSIGEIDDFWIKGGA